MRLQRRSPPRVRLQRRRRPGERLQRRSRKRGRQYNLTDKLNVLVRVDLDHARAQVQAKGHVTVRNVQALYVVVKRANALREGLDLELDMTKAHVDPEALEQLQACSRTHHLPAKIDPSQTPCTLSVLPPHYTSAPGAQLLAA